jgi:molecular chaperone DnaK
MSETIIGIDLGTTNSAVSAIIDDTPQIIPVHGQDTMPSVVGLNAEGDIIVGSSARNQLVAAPERTIESIKRLMGQDTKVKLGDKEFAPEEISAFILRELKQAAERHLDCKISKAVITVPAYFNELQRKATQAAGQIADLEVVRIVNEPTAAALAYGADRHENEKLLVYDLGGGTFDVSVVAVENGVVEVKATHGNTRLGGNDFDELLADEVLHQFLGDSAPKPDLITQRRLRALIEPAKCRLSEEPYVEFREEYFLPDRHIEQELFRNDYERLIEPLANESFASVHRAMSDAGYTPDQIDKVLLVGGATRTPLIHAMVKARLGKDPSSEINPDLIVALGAAVQAGIIAGNRSRGILVDITPHAYSTSTLDHNGFDMVCVPLIERNTPLPARKASLFSTVVDQQESAQIEVYQGDSPHPSENLCLGDFVISGLSPVPSGNQIRIEYGLDLNGLLHAVALEKSTGLSKSVTIDTKGDVVIDIETARENVAALLNVESTDRDEQESESDANQEEALTAAKELKKRAETLMKGSLSEDDTNEITQLLDSTRSAVSQQDWEALKRHNDALSDLLFYLED